MWPHGRLERQPIDGPDEDAFTLATEAIEQARAPTHSSSLRTIRVLGPFPPARADDLAAAAPTDGNPSVILASSSDLLAGVRSALESPGSESEAVVFVETADLPPGARALQLAAAFWVTEGTDASSAIAPKSISDGPRSEVAGPVQNSWAATAPLLEIGSPRRSIVIERLGGGGDRAWLQGLGPFRWVGGARPPDQGRPWPNAEAFSSRPAVEPENVSEGAYVPRATYLAERPSRWRLEGERCSKCGKFSFPARARCSACGAKDGLRRERMPTHGLEVEATTVVHRGAQPTEFDRQVDSTGDYEVVIVRAAPSVRLTLQLADGHPGSVKIGDRVDARLRRIVPMEGEWRYARKAVPVEPSLVGRADGRP